MNDSPKSKLIQLVLLPVLFYVGVKLSLLFAVLPEVIVMLWLPNSLLLVALLHYHLRRYGYFAALIIIAEIAADYPTFSLVEAALFGAINLIEVTIAYLLLRYWRFDPRFATPSDIVKFLIAGPITGAFVAACLAAAVYRHFRGAEMTYFELLHVWWLSDGTGLHILTPLILSLWPVGGNATEERIVLRWFDGIVAVAAFVVVGMFLMAHKGAFHGVQIRPVVLFPFAIYASARLTPRAAAVVMVAFGAIVLFAIKNGQQPFGEMAIGETVLQGQTFVFIMNVTGLSLAALLAQLRSNTRNLELRVEARTAELRAANEELQRLAVTDPLTGLLNRRALFDSIGREMERAQRYRHELSIIMFDIDRFKEINDLYGHAAGDSVLRHVGAVAAQTLRSTDSLARYGGEEFVILALGTDVTHALQLAERVRSTLESSKASVNHHRISITASFGVSILRTDDKEPEHILARADAALYEAKAGGRNRVVLENPSPITKRSVSR
jgi:diguanylate cyclase (GGDEF)-like protein